MAIATREIPYFSASRSGSKASIVLMYMIYRVVGNFCGMLIFAIFVVDLAVTNFPTHEN